MQTEGLEELWTGGLEAAGVWAKVVISLEERSLHFSMGEFGEFSGFLVYL